MATIRIIEVDIPASWDKPPVVFESDSKVVCTRCNAEWYIDYSIVCPCCGARPGAKDTYIKP